MKKIFLKIKGILKLKKIIKARLNFLTREYDCVNLSCNYTAFKGFTFYNNNDIIAELTYEEIASILKFGCCFFDLIIFCLCRKNSIDKY